MSNQTWDIYDPRPVGVTHVHDQSDDEDDGNSSHWGLTSDGTDWKGYKGGHKVYLEWSELVRRWGPVELRVTCR